MKKVILFLFLLGLAGTTFAQKINKQQMKDLAKGTKLFVGDFSNEVQSKEMKNPLYMHQIIRGRYIKYGAKNVKWVHLAWFHPKNDLEPIDQRLFRFEAKEDGQIEVTSYYVPKNQNKEGSWELDDKKFDKKNLRKDVCSCRFLGRDNGKNFEMIPSEPYCISEVAGGAYHAVSLSFKLSKGKLSMYSNFYNEDGDMLFGYPEGSHFLKM